MYKRTSIAFIGAVLSLALLPGCFFGDGQKALKTGLIVVNVLDKKQYDDCHIAGSINIPFKEIDAFAGTVDKEKSDIVFYCSNYMCSASGYAADKFVRLGFKQVAAYEGGTAEWHQRGLPTDGPAQESYLKVVMDEPAHEDGATLVINADELAQKMGIALPTEK